LKTPNSSSDTPKLKFISTHVAVYASITSYIPNFTNAKFILSTNPRDLCDRIFAYFDELSAEAMRLMPIKFNHFLLLNLNNKLRKKLVDYCSSLPIVGFNSRFYDIGLLSKDGFINNIIARNPTPFIIKDCNRYKVIKTTQFIFLDQLSYCAADTLLKKFIKAYDKNLNKGIFLYEWLDSYDELYYLVENLKLTDFYSQLKNKGIKLKPYNNLMTYCKENDITYIHELLKWYNNLDVEPMLQACLKQKEFFYSFNLDMYKDSYSLPSLSKNIMFQFSSRDFELSLNDKIPPANDNIPTIYPQSKINEYLRQDVIAHRSLDYYITSSKIIQILTKCNYRCIYCHICLNYRSWTLHRIDNNIGHTHSNCVIACLNCNTNRKDVI